jgi:hypothetical protein
MTTHEINTRLFGAGYDAGIDAAERVLGTEADMVSDPSAEDFEDAVFTCAIGTYPIALYIADLQGKDGTFGARVVADTLDDFVGPQQVFVYMLRMLLFIDKHPDDFDEIASATMDAVHSEIHTILDEVEEEGEVDVSDLRLMLDMIDKGTHKQDPSLN